MFRKRLYDLWYQIPLTNPSSLHVTRMQVGKWCNTYMKVRPGWGCKRVAWIVWLYNKMVNKFDHLCKLDMLFILSLHSFLVLLKANIGNVNI